MINLLPTQEKEALALIKRYKKISVIFVYFLLCLILFIAFLFFLNLYIELKIEEVEAQVFIKNQELENYKFQEFKEETIEVNQNLGLISSYQEEEILVSPFINEIYKIAPTDISFESINLEKNSRLVVGPNATEKKEEIFVVINLSGNVSTREALYSFKKILESKPYFKEVYFSPDSWTRPKDTEFSVKLEAFYDEFLSETVTK